MSDDGDNSNQAQQLAYQSPMYQYGSSIMFLTNPENELYKLELTLRGMKPDKEGEPTPVGDPLLSDSGVSAIVGLTQTIVNQVTIMSSLSKQDIATIMDFLGDTLAKDLMVNRIPYEINSTSSRDKIYFSTLSSAFICMKRAQEDVINDKKFWRGSVQEIHNKMESNQKSSGILSGLNPWKKK